MTRRTLITGINGISGFYLHQCLRDRTIHGTYLDENPLVALHELEASVSKVDILNKDAMTQLILDVRPDEIIHFAAMVPIATVNQQMWKAFDVNVHGTQTLLEIVRDHCPKTRVLISGSSDEYGRLDREEMPITERSRMNPINVYGTTKIAQEFLGLQFQRYYDLDIVFTRTFNFMGPRQPTLFVTSAFAVEALRAANTPERIMKVGNLDIVRDFLDVRDVALAYRTILEKGIKGDVYNICSSESVNLRDLIARLATLASPERPIRIEIDPAKVRKSDNPYLIGDNQKLQSLGWARTHSLDDSLRDVVHYWKERHP